MNDIRSRHARRWLITACAVALLPLLMRTGEVAADLRAQRRAGAAFVRGTSAQLAGQLDEAAAAFREAIEAAPRDVEIYRHLAEVEARRGRIDAAIAAYRAILSVYPYAYEGSLYRELGLTELRGGRPREARQDLLQAVVLDPTDWLAYHLLGHASRRVADDAGARDAWSKVLELNPGFQSAVVQLQLLDAEQR